MQTPGNKAIDKIRKWCVNTTLILSLITFSGWIVSSPPSHPSQFVRTELRNTAHSNKKRVVLYQSVNTFPSVSLFKKSENSLRTTHAERIDDIRLRRADTNFRAHRAQLSKLIWTHSYRSSDDYSSTIRRG